MTARMTENNKAPHMKAAMTIPARAPAITRTQRMYSKHATAPLVKKVWEREGQVLQFSDTDSNF